MNQLKSLNYPQELIDQFESDIYPHLDSDHKYLQHYKFMKTYGQAFKCRSGVVEPNFTDLKGGYYSKFRIEDDLYLHFCSMIYNESKKGRYHSFQENLKKNDVIRMFIDIDSTSDDLSNVSLDKLASLFISEYFNFYDITIDNQEYTIIRNKKDPNHKAHIYFPHFICQKKVLKQIATNVKEISSDPISKHIDTAYSGCRLVWMTKGNDYSSIYKLRKSVSHEMISDLIKYRVRAFKWETLPPLRPQYVEEFRAKTSYDEVFKSEMSEEILNLLMKYVDKRYFLPEPKDNYLLLKRHKGCPSYCKICDRCHDNDNMTLSYRGGAIYLYCFRANSSIQIKRLKELSDEDKQIYREYLKQQLKKKLTFNPPSSVIIDSFDSSEIKDLDINKSLQVVWSKMDSLKTVKLIKFINDNRNKFKSILFVSSRRSFARNMVERLKQSGINVTLYLDDKPTKYKKYVRYCKSKHKKDKTNYMIQVESLYRLSRTYDLVVLDEITSILSQMDSGLHRSNLKCNRDTFERLISDAKWIVMMDADIDNRAIRFLQKFKPHQNIYLQKNLRKRGNLKAYKFTNEQQIYQYMIDCIKNGVKVAICLSSIEYGKKIEQELKQLTVNNEPVKYVFHNGENPQHEILSDVNQNWINYQVVMYTSCISEGIDFHQDHFEWQFVFAHSMVNHVRQIKQMIGRIRKIKHIFYYIKPYNCKLPTTYNKIYQVLEFIVNNINNDATSILTQRELEVLRKDLKRCKQLDSNEHKQLLYTLIDNYWLWLTIQNMIERNLSKNYFDILFELMLENQDIEIVPVDNTEYTVEEEDKFKKHMGKLTNLSKDEEKQLYLKAPIVEGDEYISLKSKVNNSTASLVEYMSIKKSDFLDMFTDQSQITPNDYMYCKNIIYKLYHARIEYDLTVKDVLINDIKYDIDENNIKKCPKFLKLKTIKEICTQLGFINTLDRTTIINNNKLEESIPWVKSKYYTYNNYFNLNPAQIPYDLKTVRNYFNSILDQWSHCEIKELESHQHKINGKRMRIRTYSLRPIGNESLTEFRFNKLVDLMKPKFQSSIDLEFDIKLKQLVSEHQNKFLTDTQKELEIILSTDLTSIYVPSTEHVKHNDISKIQLMEQSSDIEEPITNYNDQIIDSSNYENQITKPSNVNYVLPTPYHPLLIERYAEYTKKGESIEQSFNYLFNKFVNDTYFINTYPYDFSCIVNINTRDTRYILHLEFCYWIRFLRIFTDGMPWRDDIYCGLLGSRIPCPQITNTDKIPLEYYINIIKKIRINPYILYDALDYTFNGVDYYNLFSY